MLIQHPFRLVVTGPESSGKTSLATALAKQLKCPIVPEFARFYLDALERPYQQQDLEAIGRGQRLWEIWYSSRANPYVVLDTDWTVLQIWEQFRFPSRDIPYWKMGYGQEQQADLYVLNAPDFPWEADPLRENPHDRTLLFEMYQHLLDKERAPYIIATGALETRLAGVLEALSFF